jgi:hypothetical protein
MTPVVSTVLAAILSGTVVAAVLGALLLRRNTQIQETIKLQFVKLAATAETKRDWQEKAVSELLGPVSIQLARSERAFRRWSQQNLFLEAKVIREANLTVRDLLLNRPHLIPPELFADASALIEHYDRWLEEYALIRENAGADMDQPPYTFVGNKGYPFPTSSARRFEVAFRSLWDELYRGSHDI